MGGAGKGDTILIQAEGSDAEEAVKALVKLVDDNLMNKMESLSIYRKIKVKPSQSGTIG